MREVRRIKVPRMNLWFWHNQERGYRNHRWTRGVLEEENCESELICSPFNEVEAPSRKPDTPFLSLEKTSAMLFYIVAIVGTEPVARANS